MKKQLLKSALAAVAGIGLMAGSASAVLVTVSYTADNIVDTYYLQPGLVEKVDNLAAGDNRTKWQTADTHSVDLKAGVNYSFIWKVENDTTASAMSATNPAGFLAEIDFGGSEKYFSDTTWTYAIKNNGTTANFNTPHWDWKGVKTYGYNGEPGKIWTTVAGGKVAGISEQAQWIWSGENGENGDKEVYVRADFAPVPEPTTMLLFGSGLLGFVAVARRRRS